MTLHTYIYDLETEEDPTLTLCVHTGNQFWFETSPLHTLSCQYIVHDNPNIASIYAPKSRSVAEMFGIVSCCG